MEERGRCPDLKHVRRISVLKGVDAALLFAACMETEKICNRKAFYEAWRLEAGIITRDPGKGKGVNILEAGGSAGYVHMLAEIPSKMIGSGCADYLTVKSSRMIAEKEQMKGIYIRNFSFWFRYC